ncbi:class I SAM-dependent methyltransferase [Blastopirellula retiformator]|uniref:Ubiquinone biosynthesis O-methyltransferase n=1 Tax=Blastopirellula retiformator TaxID=2527970 RepID=A0A5C5V5S2_9BACT|nr:methyltransferase domain-containing protein [Blastopirellula retiformator]TWT33420.1 Ubiquinone biosynthesis O-methyltransferase [Blastopirellula retiformator]
MDAISDGHYYRKQLDCKSGIIAWSHRSRFRVGLDLVGSSVPKLLDYGCGDGTFLGMASNQIEEGAGADIAVEQIVDCRKRLASIPNLSFYEISDLAEERHAGAYSVVTCMETLEHCPAPSVEIVLSDLARLVAPTGKVIISVPIEIGPTFVLKSAVRRMAAWRGLSDYRHYEKYAFRDSLRMIFANKSTEFDRPVYGTSHSHYGFNWRAMRQIVRNHLKIERTLFSPIGFLGGWFSSQAWFVCRPRNQNATP